METPVFSHLTEYFKPDRISFAMPGHKNGRGIDKDILCCDVTELAHTLDLHGESESVKKSEELLSKLYGSDESFISVSGSTGCIHAMLASVLNPGEVVLAASDCHMSVINTCALCGYKIRFIPKTINSEFLIPDKLSGVNAMLDRYSDIKAVIVTSPTYYGLCADIKKLSELCHLKNIPLLVDEAHGAHFPSAECFPESAVSLGADIVCQSAHKTLDALTGAAFMHVSGKIVNRKRLKKALYMFESSSPSYVIAASADIARARAENSVRWRKIYERCCDFLGRIIADTNIKVLDNDDKTRIVLNFSQYTLTGGEVGEILADKYGIDIEMSDRDNAVLIVTASNTAEDLSKLYDALVEITECSEKNEADTSLKEPPVCGELLNPSDGFFAPSENILLSDASGRISADNICAYPPGIPIIAMGERITREKILYINYLKSINAKITAAEDNTINVIAE